MITTDSEKIADKMRIMSLHGISKDAYKRYSTEGSWFYEILCPGFKYNMTDIQASIGIHQLEKLDLMQARREEIARKYSEKFRDISEIRIPAIHKNITHAWHLYPLLINTELLTVDRAQFIEALRAENIGASVHFIPIHLHPYYRNYYSDRIMDLQNSEYIYSREISLPLFPAMSDQDIEDVISSIIKIVDFYRK
jgi:dTDP-4-amino-4,6-dideoxygalactose transaminase